MTDAHRTAPDALEAARRILEAERSGRALAEVLVVAGAGSGRRMLLDESGESTGSLGDAALDAAAVELAQAALAGAAADWHDVDGGTGRVTLFVQAHRPADRLLVVGAGHIAVPLAELGVRLGFVVTVLDDREDFATPARFADRVRVLRADFAADPFAGVPIDERTYVALVTRGHRWDFDCLRRLVELGQRPRYVGMIGSRRRVRAAFQALLEAGVPRDVLATVYAPIGIELGAETPMEIAVSIVAEMIAVRRGVPVESAAARERVLARLLPEEVEADGG